MAWLTFAGRLQGGGMSYDYAITDITFVSDGAGGGALYTASGYQGGIMGFDVATSGALSLTAQIALPTGYYSTMQTTISILPVAGQQVLFGFGRFDVPQGRITGADGALGAVSGFTSVPVGMPILEQLQVVGTSSAGLVLGGFVNNGSQIKLYTLAPNGALTDLSTTGDSATRYLSDITDILGVSVGGTQFVVAAGERDNGFSVLRLNANGTLTATDSLGVNEGIGFSGTTSLASVSVAGHQFVIAANAGTSSLTVAEINADGTLQFTDYLLDTLGTRFQNVQAIAVTTISGRSYVAVGGSDDGVSLFTVLPDGTLFHLESFRDLKTTTLHHVSDLEFAQVASGLKLYAVAEAGDEEGISQFSITTGTIGQTLLLGATNDSWTGGAGDDIVVGGAGNDTLSGAGGRDILVDGAGSDVLTGGAGADCFIFRADGEVDTITDFNIAEDTLDLSDFTQCYSINQVTVTSTSNGCILTFGTETIRIYSSNGAALTAGQFTTDTIINLSRPPVVLYSETGGPNPTLADDLLDGSPLADLIAGLDGDDTLNGSAGNDTLVGGFGADRLDGGDGWDIADYSAAWAAITIDFLGQNTGRGEALGDILIAIEEVRGTAFNDLVYGTAGAECFKGGGGDDTFVGRGGADTFEGGEGSDRISFATATGAIELWLGGERANAGKAAGMVVTGVENVIGSNSSDTVGMSAAANTFDGRYGFDTASYEFAPAGITINMANPGLNTGWAAGDIFIGVEAIRGSQFADSYIGTSGKDVFHGAVGDDTFEGYGGYDVFNGGVGSDTLSFVHAISGVEVWLNEGKVSGGAAAGLAFTSVENAIGSAYNDVFGASLVANRFDGGAGIDTVSYELAASAVTIDLTGSIANKGEAAGDVWISIEVFKGSAFNDQFYGSAGADTFWGADGDDLFVGRGGADTFYGGVGTDTISFATAAGAVEVWLSGTRTNAGQASGVTLSSVENITGSYSGDLFGASAAANVFDGRGGYDRVSYATAASAITIDLTGAIANKGEAAGDVWISIEGFNGSDFNDQFYGTAGADDFAGGSGNDLFAGRGGADRFDGGAGSDTISFATAATGVQVWLDGSQTNGGGALGVTLVSVENLTGSTLDDVIGASSAANLIDGRGGFDTVDYSGATSGVIVNLANSSANGGGATGDVLVSVEGLTGSAFNDTLTGDAGANRLAGGAGDDVLTGAAGADEFVFVVGGGHDTISDFEAGTDHLVLDDALWSGESGTLADVLAAHTTVDGADLVLTFAGGETLHLHDQATLDPNDILVI